MDKSLTPYWDLQSFYKSKSCLPLQIFSYSSLPYSLCSIYIKYINVSSFVILFYDPISLYLLFLLDNLFYVSFNTNSRLLFFAGLNLTFSRIVTYSLLFATSESYICLYYSTCALWSACLLTCIPRLLNCKCSFYVRN